VSKLLVRLSTDGGVNPRWGEAIPLHDDCPAGIVLDLSETEFIDPMLLIRMRALIDLSSAGGGKVEIISPHNSVVRSYLERMHLAADLPTSCTSDLKTLDAPGSSKVLIHVTRLRTPTDVTELERTLEDLYWRTSKARWRHSQMRSHGPLVRFATTRRRTANLRLVAPTWRHSGTATDDA
jgi:hypothetical protein